MANIINLVECGLKNSLGTGLKGCQLFFSNVTAFWLLPKGTTLDADSATGVGSSTYIATQKAEGKIIVLPKIVNFVDNSADDTEDTIENGIMEVTNEGLYAFSAQFKNGLYYDTAMSSLSSYGRWDLIMVDRNGNLLGTTEDGTTLKGFDLGMVQKDRFTFATNSTSQREGIRLQMLERSEFDDMKVFIQSEQLDYNANRVEGVNEIVLSFEEAPSDSDTTLTIKAVRKQDGAPFTGIDYEDFLVIKNGTTANPTAGDDSVTTGTFVLTVTALATNDDLSVQLYDNSNNRNVITVDTDQYKSNELTGTTV